MHCQWVFFILNALKTRKKDFSCLEFLKTVLTKEGIYMYKVNTLLMFFTVEMHLVCFGLVLCHINNYKPFNAKSFLYMYIKYL